MDAHLSQDAMATGHLDNQYDQHQANQSDQEMGGTEETGNGNSTPTYNNGYSNGQRGHYISQSADYPSSSQTFSPPLEAEQQGSRYNSPNMQYQQQPMQPTSRPGSGLSGSQDRYDQYQQPNQRPQQATPNKNSVVIKVGMVGDAQIGKTSLMVKYVEGSWDEDYIQTLGGLS